MFSRFLVVFEGPGGFKQLRDTCRMNFHHSSYLYVFMVPNYDQKKAQHMAPIGPFKELIGVNREFWLNFFDQEIEQKLLEIDLKKLPKAARGPMLVRSLVITRHHEDV